MPGVGIVTDSTCDLDLATLASLGVEMVPLKVLIGDETYLDWTEMQPVEFYQKLAASPTLPKTSQPSPADFLAVYQKLADQGCDAIVSIHLSAALSGTHQSASLAAVDSPIPVHVIDTKKVSQAVALVVKAAVEARDAGQTAEQVAARAQEVSDEMRFFFLLDTLDNLVKGGRAGKAQGLAASLLNIKPLLEINADGIIEPFKKVKGRKKAVHELALEIAKDSKEKGRVRIAFLHACLDACADELVNEVKELGADVEIDSVGLIGAVIGTYAGEGAIGCAYYPIG